MTIVGISSSIFGMKRFENSMRAGIDIDRRIGPTTKPTNRSIAVQSPPPTTWQKTSPHRASRAIATTTPGEHERDDRQRLARDDLELWLGDRCVGRDGAHGGSL